MREQMVLDEKLIGFDLSSTKKQFQWPVREAEKKANNNKNAADDDENGDDLSALQKIFLLHSAVLGLGAKENQRNLVHLTIKDSADEKIILDQPIFSLSLNRMDSISTFNLRFLLTETTEITFKLVEGDGPVHLLTSRILEPPFDMGGYSSDDDEDDEDQFDTMSVTSDEEVAAGDRKNANLSAGKATKKAKKTATNESNTNNNSGDLQQQKKKRKKTD